MTFRVSRRADHDLVGIYVYGSQRFGTEQAECYHSGLLSTFEMLSRNPRVARLREEFTPPVRLHAYRAHLVVYVEDERGILIVRILHGRQDWEKVLS